MFFRLLKISLLLLLCLFSIQSTAENTPKTLHIQLNAAANSREAFIPIFKAFEKKTGIKVIPIRYILDKELREQKIKDIPDISYTQNSERLRNLIKNNDVEPLNDVWQKNNLYQQFRPEVSKWLSYKNNIYAIPYSQITWGFFYHQEFIEKFGPVPNQWRNFINYCVKVKNAGYELFPISQEQKWLAVGWFEYFIIRMHGIEFYNQLIRGEISYFTNEIKQSLTLWQEMIHKGLFTYEFSLYGVDDLTPIFLRKYVTFIFMSNNLGYRIFDKKSFEKLNFMPFPEINDIPKYETAPVSVLFINKNSPKKQAAKQFLAFVSEPEQQAIISDKLSMIAPNIHTKRSHNNFINIAKDNINKAKGITPFFDRAVPLSFEKASTEAFVKFLYNANIEKLTATLEKLRKTHY